uniref:Polyprenal reductase n=1 Tax=Cacopsylla melanoneura TaxID=428564 RepID=A0A8D8YDY8_9HEMI
MTYNVYHMDLNILQLLFLFLTVSIVVVGSLINSLEKHLPKALIQSFRYGKFALDLRHSTFVAYLEVPKRYFQHFYIFSSFLSTVAFYLCFKTYVLGCEVNTHIISFLDILGGSNRRATTSATSVFLCVFLVTLQCYRRLYETSCVSVFSNSRMNISHYIVGHLHYFGTITSILLEAPGFTRPSFQYRTLLDVTDVTVYVVSVTALFLWAWHQQYHSARILSDLRKVQGRVVTYEHLLPQGGLFNFVSSPHLFCEAVIYFSLYLILYNNNTFAYVFYWVLSNQFEVSLLNHWWYQSKFSDKYPMSRKAFIPYLL